VCNSPDDAFPGAPSKCSCDKTFTVGISVKTPTLSIEKSADPTQVNEPGSDVTFSTTITKGPSTLPVTLKSIFDDTDNNANNGFEQTYVAKADCTNISNCAQCTCAGQNNCSVSNNNEIVLGASGTTVCSFVRTISGDAGQSFTDVACARGQATVNGVLTNIDTDPCDDATVTVVGVNPSATLVKKATKAVVTFEVKVTNTSTAEQGFLRSICDNIYGAIATSTGYPCSAGTKSILSTTCGATAGALPATL
jgi:hypothetical protein